MGAAHDIATHRLLSSIKDEQAKTNRLLAQILEQLVAQNQAHSLEHGF